MTVANLPGVRVIVDGKDVTPTLYARVAGSTRQRLVSLSLTEKRGGEADQLDLVIDDSDGRVDLPRAGARIVLAFGWSQGVGVQVGLVEKGSFVVEDVEHAGPPDLLTIRARAADFTGDIRQRRERSWHDTTLGAVVGDIARANGLEPHVAPDIAAVPVESLAQSREGDIAFVRRLGRAHDAIASVKDGKLVVMPIGAGVTPSGRPLPAVTLHRRDGDRHSFSRQKPEEAGTVEAGWHDRKGAKRQIESHGDGGKTRRLSRTYATKEAAQAAAKAEHGRAARAPSKLDLTLALGRPDIYPDQRVTVAGIKPAIDAIAWLVDEVQHDIGERGFTTRLKLDTAPTK